MFNKPYQVIFGTVRAIFELIFLYGKKLMKSSGDCEINGAKSQEFPEASIQVAQCHPILRPNRWDWRQLEKEQRGPSDLSKNCICRRKKHLCNKKIKNSSIDTAPRGLDWPLPGEWSGCQKLHVNIAADCWHLILEWERWYFYYSLSYYEILCMYTIGI